MTTKNFQLRESISNALEEILANCSERPKNENALLRAWHRGLHDLSDEQIAYGLQRILERPSGFKPTVGEFRQFASSHPGCSSIEDEAKEAWSLVMKNLDYYSSPVFKNTAISEAIRKMGGWQKLCSMQTNEIPFRMQDFIALYGVYKRRGDQYQPELLGWGEKKDYKLIGFAAEEEKTQVLKQIESGQSAERKMLEMLKTSRGGDDATE